MELRLLKRRSNELMSYVSFILPVLLLVSFVFIIPIGKSIQMSFYNQKFVEKAPFIGWRNYAEVIKSPSFWWSLWVTIKYTVVYIFTVFAVGLVTALILYQNFRGKPLVRTLLVAPYAIPEIVAAILWLWIFDYQIGIANYLIRRQIEWFSYSNALFTIVWIEAWKLFPLHTLVLLAGLEGIPSELYEAADVDGANSFQKFFWITIPQLRQILNILLILTTIWCFRRFTTIWTLTKGGPERATETLVIQIYRYAFSFNRMSYAATIGNIVLGILIILVALNLRLSRD